MVRMDRADLHHHRFLLIVLPLFLVQGFGCAQEAVTTSQIIPAGYKITAPGVNQHVTGTFVVSGSIKAPKGIKFVSSTLRTKVTVNGKKQGESKGINFSIPVATVDAQGTALYKDGEVCLTVVSIGKTSKGKSVSGEMLLCVLVDNNSPIVEIFEPKAESVHIGKVKISGLINEKFLGQALIFFGSPVDANNGRTPTISCNLFASSTLVSAGFSDNNCGGRQ